MIVFRLPGLWPWARRNRLKISPSPTSVDSVISGRTTFKNSSQKRTTTWSYVYEIFILLPLLECYLKSILLTMDEPFGLLYTTLFLMLYSNRERFVRISNGTWSVTCKRIRSTTCWVWDHPCTWLRPLTQSAWLKLWTRLTWELWQSTHRGNRFESWSRSTRVGKLVSHSSKKIRIKVS
jgi:hypothetical protein